jgi:aminopeptidase N
VGKTRQTGAVKFLEQQAKRGGHNDVLTTGSLIGLGETRDAAAIDVAMRHTGPRFPTAVRGASITALGTLWEHCEKERTRILDHLLDLTKDESHQIRRAGIEILGDVDDARATEALWRLERGEPLGVLRKSARDQLRKHADRAADKATLSKVRKEIEEVRDENRTLKAKVGELAAMVDALKKNGAAANGKAKTRVAARVRR